MTKIGAPSGRLISDTDLLLGAELFREQLAAQAERQNERQRLRGDLFGGGFPDYNNLDTDILYRLWVFFLCPYTNYCYLKSNI